jgi:NAD(P)-dependent dehydrogenase (short-subunit alcohol dehydrogenase family)
MNTILIIGGTSGLGEGFARRFHGLGKKVIVTGRRAERLASSLFSFLSPDSLLTLYHQPRHARQRSSWFGNLPMGYIGPQFHHFGDF